MNYTNDYPKIYTQVFQRVKTPLLTLISSSEIHGSFEVTYIVLSHILFIVSKYI